MATQTEEINSLYASYSGSSSPTQPSFLRPGFVKHNSVSKSRDLGRVDNLSVVINGSIGSQAGTNTLFFKVETNGAAGLQSVIVAGNPYEDQYLSTGILDSDHRPLPLTELGTAYLNDVVGTDENESELKLPAGTYYFTVSSSQWQALPYGVAIFVIRYLELTGAAGGSAPLSGRLSLRNLLGAILGSSNSVGTLKPSAQIKKLAGNTSQTGPLQATAIVPRGVFTLSMTPYGRIKATFRIAGAARGTNQNVATLTVTSPYGGY
jgi:hypothetical protein